jgi:putative tricarboxylic transport membrane protein
LLKPAALGRLGGCSIVLSLALGCGARPAPYPSRPIDIVTHASPGGGTDTTARTMLVGAQKALGVDMAVLFKGGGGSVVAMSYAASRPRDGYTVLAITPTHLFAIARGQGPLKIDDLVGVARATEDPLIVVVPAAGPLRTLADLISLGRDRPIKWGTGLIGGGDHAAGALLAKAADTRLSVVPFAGGGDVATQLLGGSIDAAGLNLTEALDLIRRGDLRALAVMTRRRLDVLPNVPTTVELGFDVTFSTVRGYAVLKGTPEERIRVLEQGLLAGLRDPTYQRYLRGAGLDESSVAGRKVWDAQIRRMYRNAQEALKEIGMTTAPAGAATTTSARRPKPPRSP